MLLLLASCRRLLLGLQLDVSGYLSLFTSLLGQLQIVCERERELCCCLRQLQALRHLVLAPVPVR